MAVAEILTPPATSASETAALEQPRSVSKERILRNVWVLGFGQLGTWACSAGMAVLLPRYLSDEFMGRMAMALSLTGFFGLFASLGITTYLTKEVASRGTAARGDVLNALALRLPLV